MKELMFCIALCGVLVVNGQSDPIYLKSGKIQSAEEVNDLTRGADLADFPSHNGAFYGIVRMAELPSPEERMELEKAGLDLLKYLPKNAFYVRFGSMIDPAGLPASVSSIIPLQASYKLSTDLSVGWIPDHARSGNGMVDINVYALPGVTSTEIQEIGERSEKQISVNEYARRVRCRVTMDQLEDIAEIAYVYYVEAIDPPAEPENMVGRSSHRSNALASDYGTGPQYDGSGVHIMMQDDGTIGPHIDYQGRLNQQATQSNSGNHGDHVAGTIMGAGNLDPIARGMAFGADLFVYRAAPSYPGFDTIQWVYSADSIRITSTSYSNGCNDGYTGLASTLDEQINDFPALMHVFSAGNSNNNDCGYGAGSSWGNITGGHKVAKNVIAVGNLNYTDGLANSSSRGPAEDGRLKPDVCAVGTGVYSTIDPYTYDFKSGTSMSCPGTAGTLGQLYQAYREIFGVDPNGGLMKSILMNTADDLGDRGPDFEFGYGRINGRKALKLLQDDNIILDSVDQGGNNTHDINVPAGQRLVKIMVYWVDPAAAPSTSIPLVNDINMQVIDPGAQTYDPWILDHTPNAATLDAPATRGRDSINNVEQVTIANPTGGTYTISIDGYAIASGPQHYYITYQYYDEEVTLTYPNGGEGFAPGDNETIRWDAQDTLGTFDLEYTTDDGVTWNPIATVAADEWYYDWSVPAVVTGKAKVRVTRGASVDISDTTFSIIGVPQNLTIQWACPDSVLLRWDAVAGATGYEISQLGAKYMDSIDFTTADSIVLSPINPNQEDWFSVKALTTDAIGRRAYAVRKFPGVNDCPAPQDAMLEMVVSPAEGTISDCHDLTAMPVSVILMNSGIDTISNVPVNYRLDGGAINTESYTGSLGPGDVTTFTFLSTVDISTAATYTIEAWTSLAGDNIVFNDSVAHTTTVGTGIIVQMPWTEDFELFQFCSSANDCEAITCPTTGGWINEENLENDDIDWRGDNNGTPTNSTGPDEDHNPGTSVGKYLYLQAAADCDSREGLLVSPCIDLTNAVSPELSFWYHMYGVDMGELHIDLYDGVEWVEDVAPVVSGNQGIPWRNTIVDLTPWSGQIVNIRFRGITGSADRSDLAIDDINIYETNSIQENSGVGRVVVYPNPANSEFFVEGRGLNSGALLRVVDVQGRVITETSMNRTRTAFDASNWSNGVYSVEIWEDGAKLVSKKVVISR